MKIAINTRLLIKNKLEGIGRFSYETLRHIVLSHPEHEFYFLFDRAYHPDFIFANNIIPIVLHPQARHPILFVIWFEWSVSRWLAKNKMDLFVSPDGYLSLSSDTKSLAVIHDLNFEHYPQDLPLLVRWYYKYFFPKFAKKATRIATVSQFSANDIVEQYGISPSKIDVVYNGVNELFAPSSVSAQLDFRKKYQLEGDYFICVGSIHPRKNVSRILTAYEKIRSEKAWIKHKLLLVGEAYWWTGKMKDALENNGYKHDIIFTGRLADEALNLAIGGASALLYLSYFEGFGIPMIEAMRCQTAVIAANATALPEIAGKAALYADPFSVDEIADAMLKVIKYPEVSQQLVVFGNAQAEKYSWAKSADLLWHSMLKALN